MKFWKRQATLQLGDRRYSLDDFNFNFFIKSEDTEKLTTAEIEVYNLAPSSRNTMQKGDTVILNAGYQGDIGVIFVGELSTVKHTKNGVDVSTKVIATSSLEAWTTKNINKTYRQGSSAKKILDDLLNIFGIEVAVFQLAENKQYPRGKVCKGKLKDVLRNIVVDDCGSRLLIKNGQFVINPPDTGMSSGYLLSYDSGLLKYQDSKSEQTVATGENAGKTVEKGKDDGNVIKRECLLNYHLAINDVIKIVDDELNGNFRIVRVQHKGSQSGEYKTLVEVRP